MDPLSRAGPAPRPAQGVGESDEREKWKWERGILGQGKASWVADTTDRSGSCFLHLETMYESLSISTYEY